MVKTSLMMFTIGSKFTIFLNVNTYLNESIDYQILKKLSEM